MRKNELRQLRALNATPQMMEKAKLYDSVADSRFNHKTGKFEPYTRKEYKYDQMIRVQNLNGYIKISVFLRKWMEKGIKTPRYEIFVNAEGSEWITRELDKNGEENCWREAMVKNLEDVCISMWVNQKERTFANRDAKDTLNRLEIRGINSSLTMLRRLDKWQQQALDEKTKLKEQKEQEPWDKDMAMVPKIISSFEEWMRKETPDQYYIFYEYKRNQKVGFCSRCHKYVPINQPRHQKGTKCPHCKIKAKFMSSGKIKTLSTVGYGEIIQKIDGGIVIRRFKQSQYYKGQDYINPDIYTMELERDLIFNDGTHKKYSWESYKNKLIRWIPERYPLAYSHVETKLYKRNISRIDSPIIKYSAILLWDKLPGATERYLEKERKHPVIEMLARIGMFQLAKSLYGFGDWQLEEQEDIWLDEKCTELHKILGIDKSRLKRLKAMDGGTIALQWMQIEKGIDTIWPDEMIHDFDNEEIYPYCIEDMRISISYAKAYNYLKKQSKLSGDSLYQTYNTWADYLNMAEQLKMNISLSQINRPKDLKAAHNECILLRESKSMEKQAKQIEKKWKKVNSQLAKLKKFEYKNGDYQIVVPEKVVDIVREGTILKHCVHTCDYYFDRIQRDESYLFFLRHSSNPDVPWYTLEVEPSGNIRQKRTTGDNQNADFQEAVEFLKKWQKYYQKQLTKEEKKLGEKANEARLKNYAELRKKGNKVWHGKLAGQLLADVLEADFMEVSENVG